MLCKRFMVSGKVQNVFYRDATQKKADELCIGGWVRNLPDGRVEVFACGELADINKFKTWLWEGTENSEVLAVEETNQVWEDHDQFVIK